MPKTEQEVGESSSYQKDTSSASSGTTQNIVKDTLLGATALGCDTAAGKLVEALDAVGASTLEKTLVSVPYKIASVAIDFAKNAEHADSLAEVSCQTGKNLGYGEAIGSIPVLGTIEQVHQVVNLIAPITDRMANSYKQELDNLASQGQSISTEDPGGAYYDALAEAYAFSSIPGALKVGIEASARYVADYATKCSEGIGEELKDWESLPESYVDGRATTKGFWDIISSGANHIAGDYPQSTASDSSTPPPAPPVSPVPPATAIQSTTGGIELATSPVIDIPTMVPVSSSNAKVTSKNDFSSEKPVSSSELLPQPDFSQGKIILSDLSSQAQADAAKSLLLNRPVAPEKPANTVSMSAGLYPTSEGGVGGSIGATFMIGGGSALAANLTSEGVGVSLSIAVSSTAVVATGAALVGVAAITLTAIGAHGHLNSKRDAHIPYFLTFDNETNQQLAMGLYNLHKDISKNKGKLTNRHRKKFEEAIQEAGKIAKTPEQKLSLDFLSDLISKGSLLKNELKNLYGNDTYKTIKDSAITVLLEAYDALPNTRENESSINLEAPRDNASSINPPLVDASIINDEIIPPNSEAVFSEAAHNEAVTHEISSLSVKKDFFQELQKTRDVNLKIIENLQQEKSSLSPEQQKNLAEAQAILTEIQGEVDSRKNQAYVVGCQGTADERAQAIDDLKRIESFESRDPLCKPEDRAATLVYLGNITERDTWMFHQEACDYYVVAAKIDPKNVEAAIGHADALCLRGQHDAAKEVLRECGEQNNAPNLLAEQIETIDEQSLDTSPKQEANPKDAAAPEETPQQKLQKKQKDVAQKQLSFRIFYGRLGLQGFTCLSRWAAKKYDANNENLAKQIEKFGKMSETLFVNSMQILFAQSYISQVSAGATLALEFTSIGKKYSENTYIKDFSKRHPDIGKAIRLESLVDGITGSFMQGVTAVPGWADRHLFEKWREEGQAPISFFGVLGEEISRVAGHKVTSSVLFIYANMESIQSGMGMAGDFIQQAGQMLSPETLSAMKDSSVFIGQLVIDNCPVALQTVMKAAAAKGQAVAVGVSEFFKEGVFAAGGKATTYFLSFSVGGQVLIVGGALALTAAGYVYYSHCCYSNALSNAHKQLTLIGSDYNKSAEYLKEAEEYAQKVIKWDKESYLVYWGVLREHDTEAKAILEKAGAVRKFLKKADALILEKDITSLLSELKSLDKDTRTLCEQAIHGLYVQEEKDWNHHLTKLQEDESISPKEKTEAILAAFEELSNNAHQHYQVIQENQSKEFKAALAKSVMTYEFYLLLQGRSSLARSTEYMGHFEANSSDQANNLAVKNKWTFLQEINKPLEQQNVQFIMSHLKTLENDERMSHGHGFLHYFSKGQNELIKQISHIEKDESQTPDEKNVAAQLLYQKLSDNRKKRYLVATQESKTSNEWYPIWIQDKKELIQGELAREQQNTGLGNLEEAKGYLQESGVKENEMPLFASFESQIIILIERRKPFSQQDLSMMMAKMDGLNRCCTRILYTAPVASDQERVAQSKEILIIFNAQDNTYKIGFNKEGTYQEASISDLEMQKTLKAYTDRNATEITKREHIGILNKTLASIESHVYLYDDRITYLYLFLNDFAKNQNALIDQISRIEKDESKTQEQKTLAFQPLYKEFSENRKKQYSAVSQKLATHPNHEELFVIWVQSGKEIIQNELMLELYNPGQGNLMNAINFINELKLKQAGHDSFELSSLESQIAIFEEMQKGTEQRNVSVLMIHLQKIDHQKRLSYGHFICVAFMKNREIVMKKIQTIMQDAEKKSEDKEAECKSLSDQLIKNEKEFYLLVIQEHQHTLSDDFLFLTRLQIGAYQKDGDATLALIQEKLNAKNALDSKILDEMKNIAYLLGAQLEPEKIEERQRVIAQMEEMRKHDTSSSQKAKTHRYLAVLKGRNAYIDRTESFEHYETAVALEPENIEGIIAFSTEYGLRANYNQGIQLLNATLSTIQEESKEAEEKRNAIKIQIRTIEDQKINAGIFYGNLTLKGIVQLSHWGATSTCFNDTYKAYAAIMEKSGQLVEKFASYFVQIFQYSRLPKENPASHAQLVFSTMNMLLYAQQMNFWQNESETDENGRVINKTSVKNFSEKSIQVNQESSITFCMDILKMELSVINAWAELYKNLLNVSSNKEMLKIGFEITQFLSTPASMLTKYWLDQRKKEGKAPTSLLGILVEDMSYIVSLSFTSEILNFYSNTNVLRESLGFVISLCSPIIRQQAEIIAANSYVAMVNTPIFGITAFMISASFQQYWQYRLRNNLQNNEQIKSSHEQRKMLNALSALLKNTNELENKPEAEAESFFGWDKITLRNTIICIGGAALMAIQPVGAVYFINFVVYHLNNVDNRKKSEYSKATLISQQRAYSSPSKEVFVVQPESPSMVARNV